ncbi:unnamed protein product [Ostreobium quekettii]|uniref:Uncharacterized protein n=1 Tax=Ostreobium quekettii TaxID=121088 RepID=A0A8S1ILB0_9CHLO|nr:unnamed protein product [Ostreobium quekettii]|eukprot:evm.model.scf_1597.3 EVM.evm.TU.scf_1597.3   scf_1597:19757-22288(+)
MAETLPSPFHTQEDSAILVDEPIARPRCTLLELPGFRSMEVNRSTPRREARPPGMGGIEEDRYRSLEALWDARWGLAIHATGRGSITQTACHTGASPGFIRRLSDRLWLWRLAPAAGACNRGPDAVQRREQFRTDGGKADAEKGCQNSHSELGVDVQSSLESLPGFRSGGIAREASRGAGPGSDASESCGGSGSWAGGRAPSSAMSMTSSGSSGLASLGEWEERRGLACGGTGEPPCDSASDAGTPIKGERAGEGGGGTAQEEKMRGRAKAPDYEAVKERWERAWHGSEEPGESQPRIQASGSFGALQKSFKAIRSFVDDGLGLLLRKMPSKAESTESHGSHKQKPFMPAPLHPVSSAHKIHSNVYDD